MCLMTTENDGRGEEVASSSARIIGWSEWCSMKRHEYWAHRTTALVWLCKLKFHQRKKWKKASWWWVSWKATLHSNGKDSTEPQLWAPNWFQGKQQMTLHPATSIFINQLCMDEEGWSMDNTRYLNLSWDLLNSGWVGDFKQPMTTAGIVVKFLFSV